MKRLVIAVILILFAGSALAAGLSWTDPGEGWDTITGYVVYFNAGTEQYNKTIDKAELTRAAGTVTYPGPIEDELNLGYGVEYSLHIKAYNDGGESLPSNIVTFTREGFAPPTDLLPAEVVGSPAQPMGLSL